jgi:hypothetical protein
MIGTGIIEEMSFESWELIFFFAISGSFFLTERLFV